MTLQVPFAEFAGAAQRVAGVRDAYLAPRGRRTVATAANPSRPGIVFTVAELPIEEVRNSLSEAGMHVYDGEWAQDGEVPAADVARAAFVAAVSYSSEEPKPGLWVDAFDSQPTPVQVLRAMYDEFVDTGELQGAGSFEEFVRLANPNVVIVTPDEIQGFLARKDDPCGPGS